MWMQWFPWRFLVRKVARAQGFVDPIKVIAQLQNFAQPAEVLAPVELLRLAAVLQARGLMNSQAIQHNLDWIWPYWVVRQFNPHDVSFIPRAFNLTHINLSHRNWTAVGAPGCADFPIVDPAGLLTPFYDGWSLDAWIVGGTEPVIPSRMGILPQKMILTGNLAVETIAAGPEAQVKTRAEVFIENEIPVCRFSVRGLSQKNAKLAISLRPFNPEGVSFVHTIEGFDNRRGWKVDGKHFVHFSEAPESQCFSTYHEGDVFRKLLHSGNGTQVSCPVGMATAAMIFNLTAETEKEIVVTVPLQAKHEAVPSFDVPESAARAWNQSLAGSCRVKIPDEQLQFLYDVSLKTVILHSPKDVYPGPYTYKHFWFRDAAFIIDAMLSAGLIDLAEKILATFPGRQSALTGYFRSQDGEWDSNGQVLWIIEQFYEMTGRMPQNESKNQWKNTLISACRWIQKKRLSGVKDKMHSGLLPAGFSAEHLGPNDYYYWDDFWCIAGLQCGVRLLERLGEHKAAAEFDKEAQSFFGDLEASLKAVANRLGSEAMPASPYRRMDAGAIGSLPGGYPLHVLPPRDPRLLATVDFILNHCFVEGGFFHDVSHSGINPYLTLHVAQTLLRAGDRRFERVIRNLSRMASPTGQWPEAIHPISRGGCMGDGQHVWAAAEWVIMVRNLFVREEGGKLIFASGITADWLKTHQTMLFGPAPTHFGVIDLAIRAVDGKVKLEWKGEWRNEVPEIEIRLPGLEPVTVPAGQNQIEIPWKEPA